VDLSCLCFLTDGLGFPLSDSPLSVAYALTLTFSYLFLLATMSLHAVENNNLTAAKRLMWIVIYTTGWGVVVYFWIYYRGKQSAHHGQGREV